LIQLRFLLRPDLHLRRAEPTSDELKYPQVIDSLKQFLGGLIVSEFAK
jgi:hypothetical protein